MVQRAVFGKSTRDSAVSTELFEAAAWRIGESRLRVSGRRTTSAASDSQVEVIIDGRTICPAPIEGAWSIEIDYETYKPAKPLYGGVGLVVGNVMIIIIVRSHQHMRAQLILLSQNAPITETEM